MFLLATGTTTDWYTLKDSQSWSKVACPRSQQWRFNGAFRYIANVDNLSRFGVEFIKGHALDGVGRSLQDHLPCEASAINACLCFREKTKRGAEHKVRDMSCTRERQSSSSSFSIKHTVIKQDGEEFNAGKGKVVEKLSHFPWTT
jgi:hypothetical protein